MCLFCCPRFFRRIVCFVTCLMILLPCMTFLLTSGAELETRYRPEYDMNMTDIEYNSANVISDTIIFPQYRAMVHQMFEHVHNCVCAQLDVARRENASMAYVDLFESVIKCDIKNATELSCSVLPSDAILATRAICRTAITYITHIFKFAFTSGVRYTIIYITDIIKIAFPSDDRIERIKGVKKSSYTPLFDFWQCCVPPPPPPTFPPQWLPP